MNRKFIMLVLSILVVFFAFSCKKEKVEKTEKIKKQESAKIETKTVKKVKAEKKTDKGTIAYERVFKWGEEYFYNKKLGKNGKSCADCHEAGKGLKGKIYTYPKYDTSLKKVVQLSHMVNNCAMNAMKRKKKISFDSTKMVSLLAYMSQFKGNIEGKSVTADSGGIAALEKAIDSGKSAFYDEKMGTTGRVCAECHTDGEKLAGKSKTYPKYVAMADRVVTLGHMVNFCRFGPLKALDSIPLDNDRMTNILAYISQFK